MAEPTYPDAVVKDGIIYDILTNDELPSYQGLCLANLSGRFAIMHTVLTATGRDWELVHWGSSLSTTEINRFLGNQKAT
jgi:hypothetical protein